MKYIPVILHIKAFKLLRRFTFFKYYCTEKYHFNISLQKTLFIINWIMPAMYELAVTIETIILSLRDWQCSRHCRQSCCRVPIADSFTALSIDERQLAMILMS